MSKMRTITADMEAVFPRTEELKRKVKDDVQLTEDTGKPNHFKSMSAGNTVLEVSGELATKVEQCIVDRIMKEDLESCRAINWCRTAKPLLPLKTKADGNCVLHAVCLYLWAFSDSDMFLRRLLYITLINDHQGIFKKRWRHERGYVSQNVPSLRLNTTDWEQEWEMVLRLGDDTPQNRPDDLPYSSLEEIHLFVIANILRRPVIVLCDPMIRSVAGFSIQPNNFGGIYLPLQWEPHQCWKHPVVLGYHMSHFSPLVSKVNPYEEVLSRSQGQHVVPLVHKDLTPLRLHFLLPSEEGQVQKWLYGYLKICEVPQTTEDGVISVLAATLNTTPLPPDINIVKFFTQHLDGQLNQGLRTSPQSNDTNLSANMIGVQQQRQERTPVYPPATSAGAFGGSKCITESCHMTASPELNNMCSQCFADFSRRDAQREAVKHQAPRKPTAPLMRVDPLDESRLVSFLPPQVGGAAAAMPTCAFCSGPAVVQEKLCHNCISTLKHKGLNTIETTPVFSPGKKQDQSEMFGIGSQEGTPQRVTEERPSPQSPECLTEGCQKYGREEQRSLCAGCFLKFGSNVRVPCSRTVTPQPVSEHPIMVQPASEPQNTNMKAVVDDEETRTLEVKHLCSTPGCVGLRRNNSLDMCNSCYQRNAFGVVTPKTNPAPTPPTDLGLSTEGAGRISSSGATNDDRHPENEQLVESCAATVASPEVIVSDRQQVKCVSPVCTNLVFPPKQLCDNCVKTLTTVHVKPDLCLTDGCKFHGSAEFQGYCSTCFRNLQAPEEQMLRRPSSDPQRHGSHSQQLGSPRRRLLDEESQQRALSAPICSRGKHCVVLNCTRYGDPAMDGMCTRCYQRRNNSQYTPALPPYQALYTGTSSGHRSRPGGQALVTSVTTTGTGNQNTSEGRNQFFDRMARVEKGRKGPKCRNNTVFGGCLNYGSTLRQGYCSSCYDQLRGEDVVDGSHGMRQIANVTVMY